MKYVKATSATAGVVIDTDQVDKTSGVQSVNLGTSAAPQVLPANPGASVHGIDIALTHSAGAGDCGTMMGGYVKTVISGAGDAGTDVIALATRAYQGSDASNAAAGQLYGIQSFAKKSGTGASLAVSAVSAKLMVTDGAVQETNSMNAGHFHVSGGTEEGYTPATSVTGPNFDGVMIEAYPDVVGLDSGIHIAVDAGAEVGAGILISGAPIADVILSGGLHVFSGVAVTRAAVQAITGPDTAPIGSMFIGQAIVATTKPNLYIKVTASTWERIVTQAAD
jgi:hypothetical protein